MVSDLISVMSVRDGREYRGMIWGGEVGTVHDVGELQEGSKEESVWLC